jgi:hypothetical protein
MIGVVEDEISLVVVGGGTIDSHSVVLADTVGEAGTGFHVSITTPDLGEGSPLCISRDSGDGPFVATEGPTLISFRLASIVVGAALSGSFNFDAIAHELSTGSQSRLASCEVSGGDGIVNYGSQKSGVSDAFLNVSLGYKCSNLKIGDGTSCNQSIGTDFDSFIDMELMVGFRKSSK